MKNKIIVHDKLVAQFFDTGKHKSLLSSKTFLKLCQKGVSVFFSFLTGEGNHHFLFDWRKVEQIEVSITFCGMTKIRSLNREYRNKDKATDVLSFALFDDLRKERGEVGTILHLGDIFICKEKARVQAKEYGNGILEEELLYLMVHGLLHLCGFDHEISSKEEKLMEKLEEQLTDLILYS